MIAFRAGHSSTCSCYHCAYTATTTSDVVREETRSNVSSDTSWSSAYYYEPEEDQEIQLVPEPLEDLSWLYCFVTKERSKPEKFLVRRSLFAESGYLPKRIRQRCKNKRSVRDGAYS